MAPAGPEMAPLMTCWLQLEDALHCAAPCKIMGISWKIFYLSILLCIYYNGNISVFCYDSYVFGSSEREKTTISRYSHEMLKKLWELNISGQRLVQTDPRGAGFHATFSSTVTYCHIILLHIWLRLRIGYLKIPFTLVIIESYFMFISIVDITWYTHVRRMIRSQFYGFGFRLLSRQTYCWYEKNRTSPGGHDI